MAGKKTLFDFFRKKKETVIQEGKEAEAVTSSQPEEPTQNQEPSGEDVTATTSSASASSNVARSRFLELWTEEVWTRKQTTQPWIDFRDGKLGCKICSSVVDLSIFPTPGAQMAKEWQNYSMIYSGKGKSGKRCGKKNCQ